METIPLVPVDSLTITTLVDNTTDLLLLDEGPAKRHPSALAIRRFPRASSRAARRPTCCAPSTDSPASSTIEKAGRTTRILFDAGVTPDGLVENMRRLEHLPAATSTSSCSATATGITPRGWTGSSPSCGARTCRC